MINEKKNLKVFYMRNLCKWEVFVELVKTFLAQVSHLNLKFSTFAVRVQSLM